MANGHLDEQDFYTYGLDCADVSSIGKELIKNFMEGVIDGKGLPYLLDALQDLCQDKSNNIMNTWQNEATAKPWIKIALEIQGLVGPSKATR